VTPESTGRNPDTAAKKNSCFLKNLFLIILQKKTKKNYKKKRKKDQKEQQKICQEGLASKENFACEEGRS
jgi:hypothetical protein